MRREDVTCVNSRTANTEREGGGGRVMQRRIDKEGGVKLDMVISSLMVRQTGRGGDNI